MKYFSILVISFLISTGCKQKVLAGKDLEDKLVETMSDYLHETLQQGVKANVKDVAYYPDQKGKFYICRFHVDMTYGGKDTVGVVGATISNDFKKVNRTQ